ncbi:RFX DNA-binding domain-containing protein [Xylariaceae sp. FL0662B]|nr:RFX DNA-binding domain-containing protein [Xylariaceae sp. FL0662B]
METGSQPPDAGAMSQHHSRKRTQSRASTASVHSITTQPTLDHQHALAAHHGAFPDHWNATEHGQSRDMSSATPQMSAEDMMLRPASQLQPVNPFPMDSSMHSSVGPTIAYHQRPGLHHGLQAESFATNASFTDHDSQMMDRDDMEEGDPLAAPPATSKPPSSRTSANNELEMRQLFQSNRHRNLEEVARELHGNERGPNSERARQIFAMLWINQVCTKGKGSVPRGRVYANYASRCATERITVLNPASFGKLVRVLFPGLKTRRLGVRGESKYHYVNFTLMDDQPELREPAIQPALPFPEPASFTQTFSTTKSQSPALVAENHALPSPTIRQPSETRPASRAAPARAHSLYNQPDVINIDQLHSSTFKTMLLLSFPQEADEPFNESAPLILPRIEPFLPTGTDPDAAKSLAALYRSHCTSLVECIRYCREKTFFHLFTSFQGTLTMPVQKLFSNPSVAPWIEECDFVLYQRMMQIISGLTLQVVPKPVLDTLRNISERLVLHLRESFQGQPRHVVQAKEAPATIFAGLIDRALRVNLTAHAAANMLSNPANRDQMYLDWITMVRIRKISECVPSRGMDDLVDLLLTEVRDLLDPVNVPWEIECQTLYGDMALRHGRNLHATDSDNSSGQSVLDRWVRFIRSLPARFPYATPADIVWCVQRVGTEVMRDLTIAQGKSFGSWWVTKCWVDEMVAFIAEQGGFMKSRSSSTPVTSAPRGPVTHKDAIQQGSRLSSGSEELNMSNVSQSQPDRAPFPSQLEANGQDPLHTSPNHDDSGIGIRTPEEDFPMDKFEFQQNHGQGLQSLGLDQTLP